MPLSEQTIREMAAGAANVAAHAKENGIDPEYMEGMMRTQQRAVWLQALQKDGRVRIERTPRPITSDKRGPTHTTVVWVGDNMFNDPNGELIGAWPSEVLVAQVAMALAAGEDEKKNSSSEPSGLTDVNGQMGALYYGSRVYYDPAKREFYTEDGHYRWTIEEYNELCVLKRRQLHQQP